MIRVIYRGAEWDAEEIYVFNSQGEQFLLAYQIYGYGCAAPGAVYHLVKATPTDAPPEIPGERTLSITGGGNISEAVGNAVFTVTLSISSATPVTVDYTTSPAVEFIDQATAGDDYTPTSGTLTFSPGQTVKTISVPITDDNFVEANEYFSVVLSNPVGASILIASATATILDNDRSSG